MAIVEPRPAVNEKEHDRSDDLARESGDERAAGESRHGRDESSEQRMADIAPRVAPAEDETERAITENSLQHVGKKNAKRGARHAETANEPEVRGDRHRAGDDRVQQIQPRLL